MKKQVSSNVGRMDPQADPREPNIEDPFLEDEPERNVRDLPDSRDFVARGASRSVSTTHDNDAAEHQSERRPESDNPEGDTQDQDPGMRQKQNQADEKDDPLAA